MKKRTLLSILTLLLVAVFAFAFTACNKEPQTLASLLNEHGIVVDGGGFEEGSVLVSNPIATTAEEAADVLAAIADQNYDKDGNVYIFDIYVNLDTAGINEFEHIRENLRNLIKYIPKKSVRYITNFDDEILAVAWNESDLENDDLKNYKAKAEFYIRQHQNESAIAKLKSNIPLNTDALRFRMQSNYEDN